MKKLLLVAALAVFSMSAQAQSFNAGLDVGLPLGDIQDGYTLNIGVNVNYLFEVSDQFEAGPFAGYSHYLGDSIDLGGFGSFDVEDAGFIPLGAAARFNASDVFTIGADLGYAVGISPDGNDGGFYYAPKVQYSVSDAIDIVAAYKGVSVDGGSFSSVNLGVEFGL